MAKPPPRCTIAGLVVRTMASHDRHKPHRLMVVRTDDGRELTGTIPALLRRAATTLTGRRVQFRAVVNEQTGRFAYPIDATVTPPTNMAREGER